jgi:hypothetical protein
LKEPSTRGPRRELGGEAGGVATFPVGSFAFACRLAYKLTYNFAGNFEGPLDGSLRLRAAP